MVASGNRGRVVVGLAVAALLGGHACKKTILDEPQQPGWKPDNFEAYFATTGNWAIDQEYLNLGGGGTITYFFDPESEADTKTLFFITSVAMFERVRGLTCFLFATKPLPKGYFQQHIAGRDCLILQGRPEVLKAFRNPANGTALILDRYDQVWSEHKPGFAMPELWQEVTYHRREGTRIAMDKFMKAQEDRMQRDAGVLVMPIDPLERDGGLAVPTR